MDDLAIYRGTEAKRKALISFEGGSSLGLFELKLAFSFQIHRRHAGLDHLSKHGVHLGNDEITVSKFCYFLGGLYYYRSAIQWP